MTTVALTASPTQLDSGTTYDLTVVNSGSSTVHVLVDSGNLFDQRLSPGQSVVVYPHGLPVTAYARSGSGQVDVTTATDPQAAQRGTYSSYVVHGSTAGTSRPTSTGPVLWIGSVTPTNATAGDEWRDTTTDPYTVKIRGASTFTQVGGTSLASTFSTKTANFTATGGGFYECDTSAGGFTGTLESNPGVGALVAIKKVSSDTNTLTIAAAGGGTIDGSATATTATQWAGLLLEHKGSNVWRVAASMSTTGPIGNQLLSGSGAPASGTGSNGDWYIDSSAKIVYGPKASGAWPAGVAMLGAITTVQDEGSDMTVRAKLNFVGSAVTLTDDSANGRTNVTITGGSGSGGLLPHALVSGKYVTTQGAVSGNIAMSAGYEYAFPFEVPAATTITALAINVGAGSGSIRLGIRGDSSGLPGAVLLDAGSDVDATTAGFKEAPVSFTFQPAVVYWLVARSTGSANPTQTINMAVQLSGPTQASMMQNNPCGYTNPGGGSGALSGAFGTATAATGMPRICVKTA